MDNNLYLFLGSVMLNSPHTEPVVDTIIFCLRPDPKEALRQFCKEKGFLDPSEIQRKDKSRVSCFTSDATGFKMNKRGSDYLVEVWSPNCLVFPKNLN